QFNQGGFIAQFLTTNVSIKVANSVAPLFVVGASTLPADWLPAAAAQIHRLATNDPKSPETKAYIAALTGTATDIGTLFPVGAADPSLPAGIFLTPLSATEVPPQIAVPARTQGCFKLYRLKKDVSIA
ncbi:MAG: hypothetical protein FWF25_08530, partial [Propionibacteriaceae bacterium]|nr:hypothetical protein [Propionibacteriaceae bacterium]